SPLDESGGGRIRGRTVGAGMEYALWGNWTMRLEYDYLDFGARSVAMNNIATGDFAENVLVRQKAHEVKLGLNYLFNANNWTPAGYPIRPNRFELEQLVFRIERLPDTVQRDHVDWGFNVTNVYGLDYRYTIMKGIFSDQLLSKNRTYGYDVPTFYGELYFPQIAEGMNVRVGRYLSVPDIETQMAPGNWLYTHSLLYIFDPFTQMA